MEIELKGHEFRQGFGQNVTGSHIKTPGGGPVGGGVGRDPRNTSERELTEHKDPLERGDEGEIQNGLTTGHMLLASTEARNEGEGGVRARGDDFGLRCSLSRFMG